MNDTLSLPSFAKINWSLRVLGKRADNFHEVRTTLQTISLHDRLDFELSQTDEIVLSCNASEIPLDASNLVIRAGETLRQRFSIAKGARISLEKNIPAAAGLGGGSGNAAIALLGLTKLWRIKASGSELIEIASSLGADVPFFLRGGRVLATGTGTTLAALPEQLTHHLIVIAPHASVSTRAAYAALKARTLTSTAPEFILSSSQNAAISDDSRPWLSEQFGNDFETVIFDIHPEIRRAKEVLIAAGADTALMSGSGSSVFGVFADQSSQQRALEKIECEAGWRIFACVTVSRNEYRRAIGDELFRSYAL